MDWYQTTTKHGPQSYFIGYTVYISNSYSIRRWRHQMFLRKIAQSILNGINSCRSFTYYHQSYCMEYSTFITCIPVKHSHYIDVIVTTIVSQITSLTIVYLTVYSDANQREHQSSTSLAFVWGLHRDRWIPRTNGQLRGKCFHLMTSSWIWTLRHLQLGYINQMPFSLNDKWHPVR